MKLRHRGERVIGNIKQEDRKPMLYTAGSPTFTPTDTSTGETPIKQEDTKEHKSLLLQPHDDFGENDYYYRCDICETRMADFKSVLEHRTSIHYIDKRYSKPKVKNIDMEPDVHNPNFYCKSCERSYDDTYAYRQHLRRVHYMVLKPLPIWKAPLNDIVPDPNDPSLHCRACNHTYTRKDYYQKHCRNAHGMTSVKTANQSSTSSSLMDTYCQACDRRLSSIHTYRNHLRTTHKVHSRPKQQKKSDVLPNVDDPNLYCRSCEKKSTNKKAFKDHLMLVHSIFQATPRKKSRLEPNVNDPNNYCCACKKTYSSRGAYRRHLHTVHRILLQSSRKNDDRTDLPNSHDPNNYCNVCRKSFETRSKYRNHCKSVHFMMLCHFSIVHPDAKINTNHPDLYCAQCEHSYARKSDFRKHLRVVHKI
ncbi:hypothetical protein MBANPS3_001829 [Mucor bainieri]